MKDINVMKKPRPPKTFEDEFEKARKEYPGVKMGFEPEWGNFWRKHHKAAEEIIPLLLPAIQKQTEWRKILTRNNHFVPQWKHFSTWINNSCWTQECPELEKNKASLQTKKDEEAYLRRIRNDYESYLRSKTPEALLDIKNDGGHISKVAGWLIDEILKEKT